MWLYLWAVMESRLMAVDCVGRHAGSWSYIQWSTRNHGNEWKANNLGWMLYLVYVKFGVCCTQCMLYLVYAVVRVYCTWYMLYLVYAVLSVNSWSWDREIERDDRTLYSAMTVELWMRKRKKGDEDEYDVENASGYEKSGVRLAWLG